MCIKSSNIILITKLLKPQKFNTKSTMEDVLDIFGDISSDESSYTPETSPPRELPPTPGKNIDMEVYRDLPSTSAKRRIFQTRAPKAPEQKDDCCQRKRTQPQRVYSGTKRIKPNPAKEDITDKQAGKTRSPTKTTMDIETLKDVLQPDNTTKTGVPKSIHEKEYDLQTVDGTLFKITFDELQQIPYSFIRSTKRHRYTIFLKNGGRIRLKIAGTKLIWFNYKKG